MILTISNYVTVILWAITFYKLVTVKNKSKLIASEETRPEDKCIFCLVIKRPDIRHCNICGFCSEGHHHHCGVVGKCIGDPTWKFFVLFMFYSGL